MKFINREHIPDLFWIGMILTTIAFLTGQATRIRFVLQAVSPAYVNAEAAEIRLMTLGILRNSDQGFPELCMIFREKRPRQHPDDPINPVSITGFQCDANAIDPHAPETKTAISAVPIMVQMSNGQTLEWTSDDLKESAERLKESGIFRFASVCFVLGLIIQIASRVRNRKSQVAQPAYPATPEPPATKP